MISLDDLLGALGRAALEAADGPPAVDPETLAQLHAKAACAEDPNPSPGYGDQGLAALFSSDAFADEPWQPGAAAYANVLALVGAKARTGVLEVVLRLAGDVLEVLRHSGELLAPQPLAVRGAAAAAAPASHTFRQRMASYEAAVGLEAEGDGRFCVTLTLEGASLDPALRVIVWEGDRRRAVQSGDGAVHIGGLKRGLYRLEVSAEGSEVGTIDLQVHGEESGD